MRNSFLTAASILIVTTTSPDRLTAIEPAEEPIAIEYPAIDLRGFGTVRGRTDYIRQPNASHTIIQCASEQKAKLTQAKYLSDQMVLPGVRMVDVVIGSASINAVEVIDQGLIAALRLGSDLHIFAAASQADLRNVVNLRLGSKASTANSRPDVHVPMWLDRWDRFGFRFYHRAWRTPPGESSSSYNHIAEFDYAKEHGRAGFVIWSDFLDLDTPERMNNDAWWDWTLKAAHDRELPVGLNINAGNPTWLVNRYREQTQLKMPQFSGNYHKMGDHYLGGQGNVSWAATTAKDEQLELCRRVLERYSTDANITSILEPHGELSQDDHRVLLEHGPVADAGYRTYLQQTYGDLSTLNRRWGTSFRVWEEVHVPEIASFAGWSDQAIDLQGVWKVKHELLPDGVEYQLGHLNQAEYLNRITTRPADPRWLAPDFNDSSWPELVAPGHDALMHLPHRPAVYRRTIDVDRVWRSRHRKLWLYVWDLNLANEDTFIASVNGRKVAEESLAFNIPHWGAYDVSDAIRPGRNSIALRLPKGILAYRAYLSPHPPRQYPNLGVHQNAQWVDFSDWTTWIRAEAARRGMEMIRSVDPHRQIVLMAPDRDYDSVNELAVKYGGNIHNTGWMGAFWGDLLPALMRGARLPCSLEPGGPAGNVTDFKQMLGRYWTEGIQGLDYFIHIGDIIWNDEIRNYFESQQNLIHALGTYHSPAAEVAALYSDRNANLVDFPWGYDPNTNLGGGYWKWNVRANLVGRYESDGVSPGSFARGDAGRYRVIIDTNTSIMDTELIEQIESYVRNGGTFVTWAQTGRHTPTKKDAWPISRLTGFDVTSIDPHDSSGTPQRTRGLRPAPRQNVFSGDWSNPQANGLTLKPSSRDAQPLMLWEDGTVAIGARKIGKGAIIHVGCKFGGASMFDRIGMGGWNDVNRARSRLLETILQWQNVARIPAELKQGGDRVFLRHYVTNNGLYNVWTLWNRDRNAEASVELVLNESVTATQGIDLKDHSNVSFTNGRATMKISPGWTRMLLTPRNQIQSAPAEWFKLQRDWWRGTSKPPKREVKLTKTQWSVNLRDDWKFKPLADDEDGTTYSGDAVADGSWQSMNLGSWGLGEHEDVKRGVFRRRFTVPAHWRDGETALWLTAYFGTTFKDRGRIWLDGKLIQDWNGFGVAGVNPDNSLKPGSTHLIAVEVFGEGRVNGSRGSCWLWHFPKAKDVIDLRGEWQSSRDMLTFNTTQQLPGDYDAQTLRRNIHIPSQHQGKNAILQVEASGPLVGAIVNGTFVRRIHRPHHNFGERFDLNVTPWVRFGAENEIQLVTWEGPAPGTVRTATVGFFTPGVYP